MTLLQPKTFRKKPIPVDAIELTVKNESEDAFQDPDFQQDWAMIQLFANHLVRADEYHDRQRHYLVYDRLHDAWIPLAPGDWIMRGVQGEFYPIKADILETTYEEV